MRRSPLAANALLATRGPAATGPERSTAGTPAAPAVSDAQLIARVVVQDDRHAFGELVRRYQSVVRATLRRLTLGNDALADDLAQETFVLAWRNLKGFRQEARFSTWLHRIATNCWLAHARKRKEELLGDHGAGDVHDEDDDAVAAGHGGFVADGSRASALKLDLARAMRRLSDAERAALVQCYDNDLTHEEAAYVLGCPVGTLKTHVLRARQKLKDALADWAPENGR
ncbi:MAG: sigma-70 family RNA polymerase sigma factor [Proteobacteria bacterium]|nr:sigma-70 family RNA polymerase sigma factor [Pseudomonadota bacterium]